MASKMKLTYFNIPGIAEPIRWIFHYKKVDFINETIDIADWPGWLAQKNNFPFGTLPILECKDGKILAQSFAIARYLAKEHGLNGENSWDSALIDQYCDAIKDFFNQIVPMFLTQDEAKKTEIKKECLKSGVPKFLPKFNTDLEGKKYLVGNSVTWADFVVCHYMDMMGPLMDAPTYLDDYPHVKAHRDHITSIPEIKEFIAKRPQPPQ